MRGEWCWWGMPLTLCYHICKPCLSSKIPQSNFTNAGGLRAQGAAQAVEDGAVLGAVLSRCQNQYEILNALSDYEQIRMPRAKKIVRLSGERRGMIMNELGGGEGLRSPWGDDEFQKELFGYDVEREVPSGP